MTTTTSTTSDSFFEGVISPDDETLIQILTKIPADNITAKCAARKDVRRFGLQTKDFTRLWRKAHPGAESETVEADETLGEILFQYNLNADQYVRMRDNGIYITNNRMSDEGDRIITESHIIFWKTFQISGKYLVTFGFEGEAIQQDAKFHQEWHYNGTLDEMSFFDYTEASVKSLLQSRFTGNGGKEYLTGVLHTALNDDTFAKDITAQYREVIGFTMKGWQLPDKYFFPLHDETSQRIYFALKKVLDRKWNKADVIQRLKNLYLHTGIEHKDIMFAWAMYAPFAMALRDYYGLMAMLAMTGVGDRGKSPQAYTMTGLFYGHTDKNIGDSIQQSYSSMQSWMSSSTFPIVLDDCENLPAIVAGEIKNYTTEKSYMQKKGGGATKQLYTVYKPYCADLCLTFNKDPIVFCDAYFRERSFYIVINDLKIDPLWKDAQLAVQPGDMLLLLYDYTKDWTLTELKTLMDSFTTDGLTLDRNKKIIKYIKLGQYLFKKLLDIDLDLSEIKNMILLNNELNTIELVEALRQLYRLGRYHDDHSIFHPCSSWITAPFREARYDKKEGMLLDLQNIRDLQMIVEGNARNKWTMQILYQKLCPKVFPNAVYQNKFFYALTMETNNLGECELIKEKTRGIFIPMEDLIAINNPTQKFKRDVKPNKEDVIKSKILKLEGDAPFTSEEILTVMAGDGVDQDDVGQAITHLLAVGAIYETNVSGEYVVTRGTKK